MGVNIAHEYQLKYGQLPRSIEQLTKSGFEWVPPDEIGYLVVICEDEEICLLHQPLPKTDFVLIAYQLGNRLEQGKIRTALFDQVVSKLVLSRQEVLDIKRFPEIDDKKN